ncbi:hypothetical protein VCHA29O37_350011 [Vibrio chagasii]|nr:hypothetical protein VCHA29O37_350011 [Vibrio chagasii]
MKQTGTNFTITEINGTELENENKTPVSFVRTRSNYTVYC